MKMNKTKNSGGESEEALEVAIFKKDMYQMLSKIRSKRPKLPVNCNIFK